MAVYFAALQPGDTILSLKLDPGGHLTHGLKVNFSGRLYTIAPYGVERETIARRLRRGARAREGASAEADRLRRLGLPAHDRGRPVPRDRRRGRRAAALRHGALRGSRRRRPAPEPGAALRLRHLDHAQDARGPRAASSSARRSSQGARPRGLPGHAGRAARAHDRGKGDVLQDRRRRDAFRDYQRRCARTPTRSPRR